MLCNTTHINKMTLNNPQKHLLVHAFVMSKLDAYNSILALKAFKFKKLQKIQNAATKLVVQAPNFDSAIKIRTQLHWLPFPYRIQYKLLLLTYKSLHRQGPKYLNNLLELYTSHQPSLGKRWRSINTDSTQKNVLKIWTVTAPVYWEKLPGYIRNIQNL